MSQLLQVAARSGKIDGDPFGAITHYNGGIPYTAIGYVALSIEQTIDHYHQGLPFDADGRLAIHYVNPVNYFGSGAAPFTETNWLNVVDGTTTHYNGGVPYAGTSHVNISIVV